MITPSKDFWQVFKSTDGALSVSESIAIMNIAKQAPNGEHGIAFEAGVYHGKSAMSAAYVLDIGEFWLTDPIFEDEKLATEVRDRVFDVGENCIGVVTLSRSSIDVIPTYDKYCYVFIDSGDHQSLPMIEVRLLEDRVVSGGIVAFHDLNSQFIQVREAYDYLLSTGKYEEVPVNWTEIINYVRDNDLERGNNSWHHTEMEFPNFVGAVRRK